MLGDPVLWMLVAGAFGHLAALVAVMRGGERLWPWVLPGALALAWVLREPFDVLWYLLAFPLGASLLFVVLQVALTWTPSGWRTWSARDGEQS